MTIADYVDAGYAVAVQHMASLGMTHGEAVRKVNDAIDGKVKDPSRTMSREDAARANQATMKRLNELMRSTRR